VVSLNKKSRYLFAAATIIPSVALVSIFLIYPTLQMFYQSFFNVSSLMMNPTFAGLDNYKYLLIDKDFFTALKNTLFLIVVIPMIVPALSVILAAMVTQAKLREKALYRVLFFFPSVIQIVTVGILWQFVFHPTIGVVNSALNFIGLHSLAQPWLGDERFAMWAVVIVLIWQSTGYYMVMDIAGIDRIPAELYESADIDGANSIKTFFKLSCHGLMTIKKIQYLLMQ
jgi:N-acetylglucosamine transport system permease protein